MIQVSLNGEPRELAPDTTVRELLEQLGLGDSPVAVEVNREVIPRSEHARRRLAESDRIEVVTLVGGG